jgi:hypothetical protein
MRRSSLAVRVVLLIVSIVASTVLVQAQYRAAIQGTVTDSTGAVVRGAKISVTDQQTNHTSEADSNEVGFYSVTNLPPGVYTVSAEAPGFKKESIKDTTVAADLSLGLNLVLTPGAASEVVVVTGNSAPALQTEDANLNGTISSQEVQALPQFRGDPFELVRLTPGVFGQGARQSNGNAANLPNYGGVGGSIFGIYQTENAVQISANGQRVDANGFSLDGVSTNSQTHGGATVLTPNQESVQEVKVEVNSYDAENGHSSGALVQTITKSGTNNLHGSFGFREHSPSLNAFQRWGGPNNCGSNLTSCQQRDNLFIRNYFGSVGGPVWKNKVFAFFSFDHQRTYGSYRAQSWVETPDFINSLTSGSIAAKYFAIKGAGFTNPKPAQPGPVGAGQLPGQTPACYALGLVDTAADPVNGNCHAIGTNAADIGSRTGAPGTIVLSPLGGGLDGVPDVQFLDYQGMPDTTKATQFNGKLDFQATKKDLIAFSVYKSPLLKTFLPGGWVDGRQYNTFNSDMQHNTATLLWTRTISSTMVNEARMNVTHWYFDELKGNPQAPWGLPTDSITAANQNISVGFFNGPGVFHQATYAVRDTLSKVHSSHVLKFGFGLDKEQNNDTNPGGAHPNFSFANLWSFANDAASSQGNSNFDPKTGLLTTYTKYIRVSDYSIFAQDNWKVRPSLTLTMGLRWEYFTPLHDKNNSLSHVILGQGVNTLTDLKVVQGGNLNQPDRNNFGPQLGFAWSPRSLLGHDYNSRMVWRGGIGVAYTKIGESRILQADGNPPSFVNAGLNSSELIYAVSSGGPYSYGGYPANPATVLTFNANGLPVGGEHLATPNIRGPLQNIRTPYTIHYSLEMQYDLGHEWSASLSYQGSQSRKMQRTLNYNIFTQTTPQIFAPNPLIGSIFLTQSDANSSYNAMLARITHRFSRGLEFSTNYKWSKSIDFCSYDENCGDQQSYPINQNFERGPSDFDATHSLTSYALYELPFFKGRHDWLHTIAGGWQISPIVTFNSGFPWSPVFTYNGATCSRLTLAGINCTARPAAYLGGAGSDYSTGTFQKAGGNFPNGGFAYFTPAPPGVNVPGVGRNSFRGPRYTGIDLGFGKRFTLPKVPLLGENAGLEVKATAFNIFNKVNASPFGYNSGSTQIGSADPDSHLGACTVADGCISPNANFGRATGALSGRVFELTARFSF